MEIDLSISQPIKDLAHYSLYDIYHIYQHIMKIALMYFIQLVQSSAKKSNQNTLPNVTCLSHCMYTCNVQNYFLSNTCTQSGFLVFEKECSVKQNCFFLRFDLSTFQSKSLQNDASVLFSPPSIIKDTLPEEILEEMKSPPKQKNKVCCKTETPPQKK